MNLSGPIAANIFRGVLLGVGAAAPIGPVNVELARRALRGGFGAGLALGCGAVSVDVFYAVISSATSIRLGGSLLLTILAWVGIALLLFLAWASACGALRHLRSDPLSATPLRVSARAAYATGVAMTLFNPMTLVFWFSVVPMFMGSIAQEASRHLPMICLGVLLGTLGWVCAFAGLLSVMGRFRQRWWLVAADAVGAIVLFCFAAGGVWRMCGRGL